MIKDLFNRFKNYDGSQIKVILGSPSIKEGVSLLRVKSVHILDPYWNTSRLDQVIGRAIRYCSHKDLAAAEREVKVYLYLACAPKEKSKKGSITASARSLLEPRSNRLTVDEHIYRIALEKDKLVKQFYSVMKKAAIDAKLFANAQKFIKL
jgi:superfamily II DNA or RNA helicase